MKWIEKPRKHRTAIDKRRKIHVIDDSRMIRIKQEEQEEKDEDANSDGFTGEGWMPVGEEEDEEENEDGLCERLTAGGWMSDNEVIQVEIKQEAEDDGSLQDQTLVGENILSAREINSQKEEEDNDDEFAHFPTKFYIKQEPSENDDEDIVPSGVEGMINQARDSSTLTTNFVAPEQPSTSKGDIAYGEEDSIDCGKSINRGDESCLTVHSGGKPHQCCCCRCKKKLCQDDANSFTYLRSCTQRNECCYCKQEYSCKCDHKVHHTHPDSTHIPEGCSDQLYQTDHLQTDVRKKTFQCSHCVMSFSQRSTLTSHLRTHTGEKPYECSYCNKGFSQKGILTSHLRTHTGEKPYECPQCKKKFSGKKLLTHHIRRHTGEKPYECSFCGKRFVEKSGMNRHLKIHTGEKPYKCPQCKKGFVQKGNLNYHLRTHTDEKSYECTHCEDIFFRRKDLNCHLKLHTERTKI
ncbi:zinc finger protein 41-like [Lytechinus variegatus]|uniref:zinc finger protein 41-like n=1 Tax=Lytechinus variegatus TaxID=7654 RepID=UPI001BB110EF|nr:zinc finger protein 41-like [Lytechinus variegatus]